MISNKQIN